MFVQFRDDHRLPKDHVVVLPIMFDVSWLAKIRRGVRLHKDFLEEIKGELLNVQIQLGDCQMISRNDVI